MGLRRAARFRAALLAFGIRKAEFQMERFVPGVVPGGATHFQDRT